MPSRQRSLDVALGGYLLYASTLALFVASKVVGVHGTGWIFPAALIATLGVCALVVRRDGGTWGSVARSLALVVSAVALSGFLATLFYDGSFDGRWYHQEGIIRLSSGFDPLRETLPEDSLPGGLWSIRETGFKITSGPLWINHYPKASETTAAAVYAATGDIEVAKLFNFLLLASGAALAFGTYLRFRPGRRFEALVFAAALVSNPVVLAQSWTYYTDGQLYLLALGICGFLALSFTGPERRWTWFAGAAAIGIANTKFTGLVYLAPLLAAGTLFAFLRSGTRGALRTGAVLGSFFLVGTLFVGFNPYARNTLEYGHPFHPVMGNHKVDIIGLNAAREFEAEGRLFKFLQCTWARSDIEFRTRSGIIPPKIPFAFDFGEFRNAANSDTRVAGFGPFFGGLLLCSLLAYAWALRSRIRDAGSLRELSRRIRTDRNWGIDLVLLALVGTSVLNPEMWWARYVPQLWAVPFLCWIAVGSMPRSAKLSSVGFLVSAWIAIAGGLAILAAVVAQNTRTTMIVERDFERMGDARSPIQVHFGQRTADRLKFQDRSISFTPVALPDSMKGAYCDTLLYGGVIRYDSPALRASFRDRRQDNGTRKHLLGLWWRHRILDPVHRIARGGNR